MFDIFNGFALDIVHISYLNFETIYLIPKIKGVDSIKLLCLIALINVPFKIHGKAYTACLSPVAQRVIQKC